MCSSESVSKPAQGLDGAASQFPPQPSHVNFDRIGIAVFFLGIEMCDQIDLRNHAPLTVHEVIQNPKFLSGQIDRLARDGDGPRGRI